MQHAEEIRRQAIKKALEERGGEGDKTGAIHRQEGPKIVRAFADIPGLFQPFADMPKPASFDSMIGQIDDALKVLSSGESNKNPVNDAPYFANPALDKLGGTEVYIADWSGGAASTFVDEWVVPFRSINKNQFIIASVLQGALQANKAMWAAAQSDIDQIAHKTIVALDQLDVGLPCNPNGWSVTFTVVSSVASVAAIPLTGGASAAVTAVGAAAAIAGEAGPPGGGSEVSFGGEKTEEIIGNMRDAVSRLYHDIADTEWLIWKALHDSNSIVGGKKGHALFESSAPKLAQATAANVRSPEFMGDLK